ncbi:MAG TPA: M28 family peptidase, partial [Thermoanaerobaculia bacterium]|nr:M28 family peptidase [Thermoanaerobaculia bacterium]
LLLLAGVSWLAVALVRPPEPVPASAPPGDFSAERALEHVRALASEPRPVGSAAHDRARDYVLDRLLDLGLEAHVQRGVGRSLSGRAFGTVENVVGRLPGSGGGGAGAGGAVLLVAHYDSVAAGPGASDDAVGVAVILETLRALRSGAAPSRAVIALVTDAEEAGLLGADAFVAEHPWAGDAGVVLNFEARGTRGPSLMFETGAGNRRLIDVFARAAPYPAAASYSYEVYRRLPNDTDFSVFRRTGLPGLNFAHIHGAVGYHTARDTVERLDPGTVQHHGANALALTRALADAGSLPGEAGEAGGGDAVYWNPLGWSFVRFPAGWVPVLAALLILAALAVLALALVRRRVGAGGLAGGLGVWAAVLVVAVVLALAVRGLLFPTGYDFRIWGDGSSVAWALFGAALAVLGLVGLLHRLARRLVSAAGLAAGGLVLWTVAAAGVSFVAPGASYLLLVPLAGQLPAAALLLGRRGAAGEVGGSEDAPVGLAGWALLALGAVVAALVWAPALALMAVGLQGGALVVLAALGGLLLALLAPQLELVTAGALGRAVPAALLAAGVALAVAVRLASGYGPDSPRPTALAYALDADAGEARWLTFEAEPSAWTRGALGESPERWSPERFIGWSGELPAGPAPVLSYPAPAAERAAEAVPEGEAPPSAGSRRVRVIPPPGADRLRLFVGPAA